jgi:lipopolysaccharide transport system permease protein
MKKQNNLDKWDTVISPKRDFIYFNFREIFKYRDLIFLFIKRDFVTFYKQTILGPLWYIIQPLINAIVFTIIFGNLAKIPTEGVPPFIFYLAGNIIWGYFAICLSSTSNTFVRNSDIFGKVYFPRITIPISNIFIGMLQFFIQFIVFVCFLIYFYFSGSSINIDFTLIFIPLLLFQVAITGLGFGLMISSLTSKYRDLTFVMSFGVQLWMYATPIVYPLSLVSEKYRILFCLNPMTSVVESFRYIFFKESVIKLEYIFISIFISILVLILGMIFFNKTEKSFLDTV